MHHGQNQTKIGTPSCRKKNTDSNGSFTRQTVRYTINKKNKKLNEKEEDEDEEEDLLEKENNELSKPEQDVL